jgi:hypothetical protein
VPYERGAEPERLATRAWGMSGPVRIQEQNRDRSCGNRNSSAYEPYETVRAHRARNVVEPCQRSVASSASASVMRRRMATAQAPSVPKSRAPMPIKYASRFLREAKAAYLDGMRLNLPGCLIAHAPWKTQPHWWNTPCKKPKQLALSARPTMPRCGLSTNPAANSVEMQREMPAILRKRASRCVVIRDSRTQTSSSSDMDCGRKYQIK